MKLVQTTWFGVRGERYTIKKRSPFGKLLTHGQAPVMNVRLDNPEACEPKRRAERERTDGRSGEADGCLLALAGMIGMLIAVGLVTCRPRVTVEWIKEYPDPVCERCGKVLDGTSAACPAEGF
jgi:hypothetical protein